MSGAFLYQWVLASASGERMEAIQALNDVSLCRLAGWLEKDFVEGETTGDVLGMCLVEGHRRFSAQLGWKIEEGEQGQDVPATKEEGIL